MGTGTSMSAIDLAAFQATPLRRQPFDHLVVTGFVRPEALPGVNADFPKISHPGSFQIGALDAGPAFAALIEELQSAEMRAGVEEKFGLDLARRPLACTLRGRCRADDGRIHTDCASKILTVLIYLQPDWTAEGGRLRLLRSADDIEDYVVEVPPQAGMMLAFRCARNAWHGHKPFEGERRSIQLNWLTNRAVLWREHWRHRLSARVKSLMAGSRDGVPAAAARVVAGSCDVAIVVLPMLLRPSPETSITRRTAATPSSSRIEKSIASLIAVPPPPTSRGVRSIMPATASADAASRTSVQPNASAWRSGLDHWTSATAMPLGAAALIALSTAPSRKASASPPI